MSEVAQRAKAAWARLIRKVYESDPLECPKCKGPVRVIAGTDAEKSERSGHYRGDFLATDGFFSNSPGGRATVAIALGGTTGVRDTSIGNGGSNVSFNGYALVKWYAVRPRLRPMPDSPCYRTPDWMSSRITHRCTSLGIFAGTNVTQTVFKEIVFGVSLGHVFDNVGFVLGVNSIAGGKNGQVGRKQKPFFGIDYSF